jgi:hypothetical protein
MAVLIFLEQLDNVKYLVNFFNMPFQIRSGYPTSFFQFCISKVEIFFVTIHQNTLDGGELKSYFFSIQYREIYD